MAQIIPHKKCDLSKKDTSRVQTELGGNCVKLLSSQVQITDISSLCYSKRFQNLSLNIHFTHLYIYTSLLHDMKRHFLNMMVQYTVGHCFVMARMNGGAGKSPLEL